MKNFVENYDLDVFAFAFVFYFFSFYLVKRGSVPVSFLFLCFGIGLMLRWVHLQLDKSRRDQNE